MTVRRRVLVTIAVAATMIGGCSSGDSDLTDEDMERYLQASSENSALRWQVDYNLQRIALLCMEESGFDVVGEGYEESFVATEPLFQDEQSRRASRGLAIAPDPEQGYMVDIRSWEIGEDGMGLSDFNRLPEGERNRWYEAWFGPHGDSPEGSESITLDNGQTASWPVEGCLGEAYAALFGEDGYASFIQEAIHAQGGIIEGWDAENEVVEARAAWIGCMADSGYSQDFDSPNELRRSMDTVVGDFVEADLDSPEPEDYRAAELEMARIDIACQNETNVAEIEYDAYSRQLAEVLHANEEVVFAFAQTAEDLLIEAQDILESGRMPS